MLWLDVIDLSIVEYAAKVCFQRFTEVMKQALIFDVNDQRACRCSIMKVLRTASVPENNGDSSWMLNVAEAYLR